MNCPHCGKPVPAPSFDVGAVMAQAVEKIGPERLAAQDKVPADLKILKNALTLLNEKVNILGEQAGLDLKNDPRVKAVKERYG